MKQSECCRFQKNARVLILSQRAWNRQFYMPLVFEFEDVIASVDQADILTSDFRWQSTTSRVLYSGANLMRSRMSLPPYPGIRAVEIERDYELFFCMLSFAYETPSLERLKNLRKRCRKAVVMFTELWTSQVSQYRRSLKILDDLGFDCIFVHHRSCLPALQALLRTPCEYLPLAVDCLRFTPHPTFPARSIDCYNMGRRSPVTHQSLLEIAGRKDFFYLYDTVAKFPLSDWKEHRNLLASLIARTRYLPAFKPALRQDVVIGSDESLAARWFEGAAGGAVILGVAPDCQDYREAFDWPDATIPLPYDCPDIGSVLAELDSQPDRMARVRRNNMAQSLLRHDWVYRWQSVLRVLEMESTPSIKMRQHVLRSIASAVENGAMGVGKTLAVS